MTIALQLDKNEVKRRGRLALARRVPSEVSASLLASRQFKADAGVIASYVLHGVGLDKARVSLARIEAQQGVYA